MPKKIKMIPGISKKEYETLKRASLLKGEDLSKDMELSKFLDRDKEGEEDLDLSSLAPSRSKRLEDTPEYEKAMRSTREGIDESRRGRGLDENEVKRRRKRDVLKEMIKKEYFR